jgi:hypothetical protein
MRTRAVVFMITAIALTPAVAGHLNAQEQLNAQGQKFLATFNGGIGVDPVSGVVLPLNADGTLQNVRRNLVKGVVPAPGPWRIADLGAEVDEDGRIKVKGRGLLLAGGDNIGRNGNLSVFATLICEATAPFVERNSAATTNGVVFEGLVPLQPNGDFRINDTLKTVGGVGDPVPSACPSPTLLIRAGNGAWLAAGIPLLDDDDR